ncbi:MAG: IclR family transcriptional regulator [Rhodoplanes sp.]|uniref:IclR family transcriptional regulator n=1 Tax=Rhodoplanes sp. TaxID=1968906 RepID=UPI00182DAA7B|nr:IclR family transcriptional regulator [Rhodoplanes sp.]NVO16113.1 IclR family transcriptional regulator [Rhodoplanes sp.]
MARERVGTGVRSLELALGVLEVVVFSDQEWGVTQIADRLKVTKGSVHRHLQTFTDHGYLAQNPATARYAIGPKCRLLAALAPDADIVQVAAGPMRALRDALGQTVVLSSMTPRGALVLTTLAGASPIAIGVRAGSELSFHASAQGKVLLAFAPRPVQVRMLARALQPFTSKTVVDPERLDDELSRIRTCGFASAPEEVVLGINTIATPVFDDQDGCAAALAIVGSIQHLPDRPAPAVIAALKDASSRISRQLGHGGPASDGAVRAARHQTA